MNRSQRVWVIFASTMLLVFALLLCAYAAISFVAANYSEIAQAYPILVQIAEVFVVEVAFISAAIAFLTGYELIVALVIPAILLIVCAILSFTRFKTSKAKYVVAIVCGLLVSAAMAYWMLYSLNPIHHDQFLVYLAVVIFPVFTLAFAVIAIVAGRIGKQQAAEQSQEAIDEEQQQPILETDNVENRAKGNPAPQPTVATAVAKQQQEQQAQPQQPAEQPKPVVEPNPYYRHKPETVSEIVARTYGSTSNTVDETKRKKLEKIQQMYDLGAIDRYEYQQLTIRILSDN